MFELYLTLCLVSAPDICAERLVPSPSVQSETECVQAADARGQSWLKLHPDLVIENMRCGLTKNNAIEIKEISDGVFVHKGFSEGVSTENIGDIANLSFVVGDDAVAVIDAGGTRGVAEGFYSAIRSVTDKPIRYLVVTHMHPDHSLGSEVFKEAGATIIGNSYLADALQRRAETYEANFERLVGLKGNIGFRVVLPDLGVDDRKLLDLGGRELLLQAYPTAHTNNDLTVFDRQSGTLFSGDLVFMELTPVVDGSLMGWIDVLEDIRALDVTQLVPGHGPVPQAWPDGLNDVTNYLAALRDQTRVAVGEGISLSEAIEIVAQDQRGEWKEFDLNHPRNATVAYTELEWE